MRIEYHPALENELREISSNFGLSQISIFSRAVLAMKASGVMMARFGE